MDEQKFAEVFRRAAEQAAADAERDKKVLMTQYGSTGKTIPLHDIYYMESQNHKIAIHTKDGVLEYYAKMGDLEEELKGQFCRVHKGYLINLSYVDEYNKTEVTLINGDKLRIPAFHAIGGEAGERSEFNIVSKYCGRD